MGNRLGICQGKWTWMKGEQRSVIDYALISEGLEERLSGLVIDEGGVGKAAFSDHNWVLVGIEGAMVEKGGEEKRSHWRVGSDVD